MKAATAITALVFSLSVITAKPEAEAAGDEIVDPAEEFSKATTFVPPHELDDWNDWETWEAPAKLAKMAPYYKTGFDFDGLPLYVMEYGKWDYRAIANLPQEELEDFSRYFQQFVRRVLKDGAANNDQGIAVIGDWDGFALSNIASSKALKLALKSFTGLLQFNNALRYSFQININFAAETFLNIARPFLGNIPEKFEIYGPRSNKWKPALLRKIPQDQLPPHYGGNQDWKPIPFV